VKKVFPRGHLVTDNCPVQGGFLFPYIRTSARQFWSGASSFGILTGFWHLTMMNMTSCGTRSANDEWLCTRWLRTSDHLNKEAAERELSQFERNLAVDARQN
jgi:hypothetical protein